MVVVSVPMKLAKLALSDICEWQGVAFQRHVQLFSGIKKPSH